MIPVWLQTEAWVGDAAAKEGQAEGCCIAQVRNCEDWNQGSPTFPEPFLFAPVAFSSTSMLPYSPKEWAVGSSDVEGVCVSRGRGHLQVWCLLVETTPEYLISR